MTREEIEARALLLDPTARAQLAERLLASLGPPTSEEIAALWDEEALRRDGAVDADPSRLRAAEEVIRDARTKHR